MKKNLQKRKESAMTLIEITLVIAILLSLIAILFLGISAYKKGADRSKCILTMSTIEKLIISHTNMYGKTDASGNAWTSSVLWDANYAYLASEPKCPADNGSYTYVGLPTGATGTAPFSSCDNANPSHPFAPYGTVAAP